MTQKTILYSALSRSGDPFSVLTQSTKNVYMPNEMVELDGYLVIWGGEDIATSYYGEKPSKTYADEKPSYRDEREEALIRAAFDRGIPVIGICRGAQLACCLLGGSLIQDVTGHGQSHEIITNDERVMTTTSLHHQMMVPEGKFEIIARTYPKPRSAGYVREKSILETHPLGFEPEIIYWPEKRTLGIQGHPEFCSPDEEFSLYCVQLVRDYLQ